MLRVVHSDRAEHLLAALIDALGPLDPFAPQTIIVGSHVTARWLQREIAVARGIATGLEITRFEPFVERTWGDDAAARNADLRALDRARLTTALASALADGQVVTRLPAVASYLAAAPAPGDRAGPRRVQLAEQLGHLVWAYASTRPDWMPALLAGQLPAELADAAADPDAARWQAALLAAAIERLGPGRWAPTPCLPWARRRAQLPSPALPPVVVFGISVLSRAQLDALTDLAIATDVTVYVVDPCRELWDDLPGRAHAIASEPLLLSLWGKPVRDTIASLVERAGGDIDDAFDVRGLPADGSAAEWQRGSIDEPPADTALRALLADMQRRTQPIATADGVIADRPHGVAVLACPNVRRETEIVADAIRARLDADLTLRAHEIAVWIAASAATAERYLAQAPSAFEAAGVPCHIIDAPIDDRGRIGEAVLAMLELPTSTMRRRDLLRVMTHPAVLAAHPHVDAADWIAWTAELGIAHGADAAAHAGTYLDEFPGYFHWDQGVRRLALGAFMTGTGDRGPARIGDGELAPHEVAAEDQASAATFALIVRSLTADAQWLAHHTAPLTEWAALFAGLVDAYLAPATDDARRDLERVRGMLAAIAHLDVDGRELGFREARAHAVQRLAGERADRGEPLAAGVMIAPLRAQRALPFRAVYVLGLAEGEFPAGDPTSPLDLRTTARAGDVSPRDRDRHAFLEVILGAREALALSYVAIDETSGSPLPPSSVVLELADALAPYVGAASSRDALAKLTVHHPLHRYAEMPAAGVTARPAVARERWATGVRDAIRAHLVSRGYPVPDEDGLLALLAHPSQAELRAALALSAALPASTATRAPRPISIASLRGFLEAPVQAWARVVLGLHELPDETIGDHSDEPFHVERPARVQVLREVLAAWLRTGGELADRYAAVVRDLELRGQFPVGVFGEAARGADIEIIRRWRAELGPAELGGATRIGFGRAHSPGAELRPALELVLPDDRSGARRVVRLVGQTELLIGAVGGPRGHATSAIPLLRKAEKSGAEHIRGALDHAILAAAGLAERGHAHVVLGGDGSARRVEHAPWPADDARAYLAELARELLDDPHGYLLPLDALRHALAGKPPAPSYNDQTGGLGYGPIISDAGLAIPRDARALAERRLAPLVVRMRGDHSYSIAEAGR